jgi:hypothetical protein
MRSSAMKCSLFAMLPCAGFAVLMSSPVYAQTALLGLRTLTPGSAQQTEVQNNIFQAGAEVSAEPQPAHPLNLQPPAMLVLPAGTIITVEASELLSSDDQHEGDSFVAELQQPLVIDGWVVARPGQSVVGRIAGAKKAGRVKGTSKLSLELQQIALVDGHQTPLKSDLVENSGATSHGRDLAAVAVTTGVGAAVGAVCGVRGAAIGAAVGATVAVAGVLLTRGEKTVVGPEKLLTFRLMSPLTVSTELSPHSFWRVTPDDYLIPGKIAIRSQRPPVPAPSQRIPPRVPISVWPETQGLALGRPGRRSC